jgi:hypothetical protein
MEARAEAVFVMMVITFGIFCLTLVVLVIVARTSQAMQDALRTLKDAWRTMWLDGSNAPPRSRRLSASTARLRPSGVMRRRARPGQPPVTQRSKRGTRQRRRPRSR